MKTIATALFVVMLSGCACWSSDAKNSPGCIVAHDVVDCTVDAVKEYAPIFGTILAGIISSGVPADQIPWDTIVSQVEALGIKDGGCFLAELKNLLFGAKGASPAFLTVRKSVGDALNSYKMKKFNTLNVRFKIIDKASGKAVEI
jgi:hypothetical protein